MKGGKGKSPFSFLLGREDGTSLPPSAAPVARENFGGRPHETAPATPGAHVRTILDSLALKYRGVIKNVEYLTGQQIRQIRVIGGGSKNHLLNQLTADATGTKVLAGPPEATALGNPAVQILATGGASPLQEGRGI